MSLVTGLRMGALMMSSRDWPTLLFTRHAQRLREVGVRIGVDGQNAAMLGETLDQHAGDEGLAYSAFSREGDGDSFGAHFRLPSRTLSSSSSIRFSCES